MFVHGARVGFFQGDSLKIMEDAVALRPTLFASVPRLLNRIHDKIMSGVQATKSLKSSLFLAGYNAKMNNLRETGQVAHSLWDKLIFNKVAAALGLDRCRVMTSGAAPLPKHIMDFYRILLPKTMVFEGYGQTESSGIISVTAYEGICLFGRDCMDILALLSLCFPSNTLPDNRSRRWSRRWSSASG